MILVKPIGWACADLCRKDPKLAGSRLVYNRCMGSCVLCDGMGYCGLCDVMASVGCPDNLVQPYGFCWGVMITLPSPTGIGCHSRWP